MQERQVSIEGTTRPLPEPFVVLATQNPIEFEGTFALPQAQLDRFLVRVAARLPRRGGRALDRPPLPGGRRAARRDRAGRRRPAAARAPRRGPARSASPTRSRRTSSRSSGPPGSTRTSSSGRARGRRSRSIAPRRRRRSSTAASFVLPDDVKAIARPVLAHRLVVDLDRSLRGASAEAALAAILDGGPRRRPATEP